MGSNDINLLLEKHRKLFFGKCSHYGQNGLCTRQGGCACRTMAEMWAYIDHIVPEEYARLELRDYTGMVDDKEAVTRSITENVQRDIWEYCFGNQHHHLRIDYFDQKLRKENFRSKLDAISVMDQRYKNGTNLIIHGEQRIERNGQTKLAPKGKTMLASIVMMEAIRRKLFETNSATTFMFENFALLKKHLKERDVEIDNIRDCDWLVVDDIYLNTQPGATAMTKYTIEMLDEFVMYRLESKLPTIWVFGFDIKTVNLLSEFGYGMMKIASSGHTITVKV
jgi:hypothetical protein